MYQNTRIPAVSSLLLGMSLLSAFAADPVAPATPQGTVKGSGYLNIGGTAVSALTDAAKYPAQPDVVFYYPYFEWNATGDINTPANNAFGENYGAVLQGYFYPPTAGDYVFLLSADDNANLYLSTDSSPANKKLIAQEDNWSNPRSWDTVGAGTLEKKSSSTFAATEWETKDTTAGGAKITLQANKPYYIEAVVKEGGGGDNLAVAVNGGGIDATLPIPGKYLSPFAPATAPTITAQPGDAAVNAGFNAVFSVGVDIPPGVTGVTYKWTKNGTDIPNSDTNQLVLKTVAADNGAKIQALITSSAGSLTSSSVTLSVATLSTDFTPGVVKFEAYSDITGTSVDLLTGDPKYIAGTPDDIRLLSSIDTPNGYADNYGAKVSGFIIPPETGSYRFFIRSDDASQLFLSPDDKEANAVMVAEETGCCNAFTEPDSPRTSEPISLTAGKKYAFYAFVKEGGGGDFLQVAARKEGDTTPAGSLTPIGSTWLGANAKPSLGDPQITSQPQSIPQLLQGRTVNLSIQASVTPAAFNYPYSVKWQKDGVDIPGATGTSYVISNATAQATGKYHAIVTAPSGKTVTSSDADVTFAADTAAPKVASVAATGLQAILVAFDEPLDKATAETAGNYSLSGGLTVTKAIRGESGDTVLLTTSPLTAGQEYTLTVGGIKDPYSNTVPAGTTTTFKANVVSYADIILADGPIAFYRFEETSGSVAKNSGSKGGDGAYYTGDEATANEGGTPATAKGDAGPQPPAFLGFASDNRSAFFGGPDTQEWIDTKNKFLDHQKAFTLEYWVNPTNRVGADPAWSRIGIVGQNDAIEYGFINGTTIQIWTPNGGSLDTTYTFGDNEWHHVATIADGKNINNYFDGKLVGKSGSATSDYGSSTYNVHIGGAGVFDVTGNYFHGHIDEVAIFDKAIPAERVAIHYQAGKNGYVPPSTGGTSPNFSGISFTGGQVTISWTTGTLLSAPAVNGPYTAVAGAASPFKVTPTGGALFYKLQ